jgi:[histone H3]-trimethyl-L-lysine4 demethylase
MKDVEAFTCPICDWRVKIPRDAARPKLEDLQYWADEMPSLPFQPEEEEILKRIINKAQAFRDFLQQFINGNQICRTAEEMPTMLFYLRKLEGAEILLAYETNTFRQELHKWQPIALEPPPVLEQSLSTRKPRPTKLQKTMKEMGVQKIEDLPPHLRTKTIVKRKSTDPSINGAPRPLPLQPAHMQPDSSGSGQAVARSDTPMGMPRQSSTGNPPSGGHYNSSHLPMSMAQSPTYGHPFATSGPPSYPPSTPSPMFSPVTTLPPNGLRDPMMARFPGGPSAGPSSHDLFSPNFDMGMDPDDDIRTGLANGGSAAAEPNDMSSPHTGTVDEMFLQMTNQEPDTQNDAPTGLEAEASQASEALDMIRKASGDAAASHTREGDEGAIDPEKGAFDEFFEDGDTQA